MRAKREVNQSELDLSRRLELARRNSRNQHGLEPSSSVMEIPVEETIYEGLFPFNIAPFGTDMLMCLLQKNHPYPRGLYLVPPDQLHLFTTEMAQVFDPTHPQPHAL